MWGYIWLRGLDYNPLYEQDFERIGCYLCASCLESEWKRTSELHPKLHGDWQAYLDQWSKRVGVGPDFVRYGFWRWKVLPPKMRQLAEEVNLKVPQARSDRLELKMTKGVSPCLTGGYSIEGVLILPKKRDFSRVGETLKTVGKVKFSEEFEIALVKNREGTVKVFGGGQVVATAVDGERGPEAVRGRGEGDTPGPDVHPVRHLREELPAARHHDRGRSGDQRGAVQPVRQVRRGLRGRPLLRQARFREGKGLSCGIVPDMILYRLSVFLGA